MSAAFLFGKMPAHGDFVRRGLDAAERDSLDRWLTAEMAAARAALGDSFEDSFDAAPPWRFAWSGDLGWTAGALAASMDGVGRRYPLLLGRRELAAAEAETAARLCEDALYDALPGRWSADRLLEAAAAAVPSGDGNTAPDEGWWTEGGPGFGPARFAGRTPPGLLLAALSASVAGE